MADQLPQVLVLRPPSVFTLFETRFSQKFHFLRAWESPLPTADFLATHAASVKAVLCSGGTPITADILRHLPSLQLIVTTSAGLNHINLPECRRHSISVASAGEIFSDDCADLAVGLLIDVLRKVSAAHGFIRAGLWPIRGDYPLGSKNKFSPKFQLLKAWESPLPTPLFLTTHAHSVMAVLSSSSSPITSDILHRLPSLQLVVATTVGLDQIDLYECRRGGISITNAGKVLAEDCADMAVGLFVDILWKISAGDWFVRSGLWPIIQKDFSFGSRVISFFDLPCLWYKI